MSIILNSTSSGIVVSEPHNIIGGKDSLKISITFKPDASIYDYDNSEWVKNKKYYRIFTYEMGEYSFIFDIYTNTTGNDDKLRLWILNTDARNNKEISGAFGNTFSDGLEHSIGFHFFNDGNLSYLVDDIVVSTDRWNPSGSGKAGTRGNIIQKYSQMVLGNSTTLDYDYPLLGDYINVQVAEETVDEEGDPIFEDWGRSYLNNDINLTLIDNLDDITKETDNLSDSDMVMIKKGYKKGRFNTTLLYRDNNKTTLELEDEAELLTNVTDRISLQNINSTVIVRVGEQ